MDIDSEYKYLDMDQPRLGCPRHPAQGGRPGHNHLMDHQHNFGQLGMRFGPVQHTPFAHIG